jgi:hypothetical protein
VTTRENAYECQFTLPAPIHKVKSVSLKSAEMPITFGQTRGNSNAMLSAGYFEISVDGVSYSFVMTSRTYSTIAQFISDFNDSFSAIVSSGKGGVLSLYTEPGASGNQFFLQLTFSSSATIVFKDTPLSRCIMGFKSDTDSATGTTFVASCRYNLNSDNFLAMVIPQIPNAPVNVSSQPITFKIPLTVSYSNVLYYSDKSNGFQQTIEIPRGFNYTMDRLSVYIYDRWGYQIPPYGGDFSFTLCVEYDE